MSAGPEDETSRPSRSQANEVAVDKEGIGANEERCIVRGRAETACARPGSPERADTNPSSAAFVPKPRHRTSDYAWLSIPKATCDVVDHVPLEPAGRTLREIEMLVVLPLLAAACALAEEPQVPGRRHASMTHLRPRNCTRRAMKKPACAGFSGRDCIEQSVRE